MSESIFAFLFERLMRRMIEDGQRKGGGRMTDSWEAWKSSRQPKQVKIRRTGAARGIPEPLTLD